ncbi:MAG: metal ABC transporter ATP-binding protein [Dermatophilaceae bacterium]
MLVRAPLSTATEASRTAMTRDPVISLRDASFGYGGSAVVRGITLEVARGDSLAVLGANGGGKSTLVKGLLGLNEQLSGDVRVLGEPLGRLKGRGRVGYVPQRHTLSTSVVATVGEVVAIGRLPRLGPFGRMRAPDRAIVADALEVVGLGGLQRADVTHLSGGQQRRVLVARALAAEPEVLVMDEPTAGVDEENQLLIARAMIHLAGAGVTLLTVTHELDALSGAVDRVIVVDGGRIVFDGAPGDLARRPDRLHLCDHHEEDDAPEPHEIPRSGVPLRDVRLPLGDAHA